MGKRIIFNMMFFIILLLSGCANKESLQKESSVLHENISENGYNLSVSKKEKEEAESECKSIMEKIKKIYLECDKGTASNLVVLDETALEMVDVLKEEDYPVYYYSSKGMSNYEKMEDFLERSTNGKKGNIVCYQINSKGGVGRNKFIFDGKDMYYLYTNCIWSEDNTPIAADTFYNKIKKWEYTKKGWFCYEICTPEPPELTEVMDGNCMIRVKPIKKRYDEISSKYLDILGYQGNNLLCSNWDADNLEELDYTGLYEYLYYMKYRKKFNDETYQQGIPKREFEKLMMECLPVNEQQLQKYAMYDEKRKIYAWCRLGCMNYTPNAFGYAIPEITKIKKNKDGTLSIQIDAVCDMLKNDSVISHILTVKIYKDGKIKYLSNRILGKGLQKIPAYQYRIKKYKGKKL